MSEQGAQKQQCGSCGRLYTGVNCLACQNERRRKAKQKLSLSSAKRLKKASNAAPEACEAAASSSIEGLKAVAVDDAQNATNFRSTHDLSSAADAVATASAQDAAAAAVESDQENAVQPAAQWRSDLHGRKLHSPVACCDHSAVAAAIQRSPAAVDESAALPTYDSSLAAGTAADNFAAGHSSAQSCDSSSCSAVTAVLPTDVQLLEHQHDHADADSECDEDAAHTGFDNCSDGESYDGDNATYCDDDAYCDTDYYNVHSAHEADSAESSYGNTAIAAATDDSSAAPDVWVADAKDCCIVCNSDISQLTLLDRELHVNACLDGSANTSVNADISSISAVLGCAICSADLSEMTTEERHQHSNDCLDAAIREQASSARASAAAASRAAKQSSAKQQQVQLVAAAATTAAVAVHNTTDISAADYCCRLCGVSLAAKTLPQRLSHVKK